MTSEVRGYLGALAKHLHLAVFTLSAMSLAVLLGPALLDHAPKRREKRLTTIEDVG